VTKNNGNQCKKLGSLKTSEKISASLVRIPPQLYWVEEFCKSLMKRYPNTKSKVNSIGMGKANGTFGELMQGVLLNQRKFMVTFPIELYSYVTFAPKADSSKIITIPEHKIKSNYIAQKILKHFNINMGGELIISSELPEGKGLASSSADLVATAYAVASAINVDIEATQIAKFISEIEPSDGVMYPGIVSFYYQEVELIDYLGSAPNLVVVAIDEGYIIDTLLYNEKEKFYTEACAPKYQDMLTRMVDAIRKKDFAVVGELSTESAMMNQKNNPKQFLHDLISISNEIKGLGVCVAHSGSFIGILLDSSLDRFSFQKEYCLKKLKQFSDDVKIFKPINFDSVASVQNLVLVEKVLSEC